MAYRVDINSDIGESFGAYKIGMDEEIVKYIQLKPGDKNRFKAIDLPEAHRLLVENENKIKKIKETLKTLRYFNVKVDGKYYDVSVEID